MRWLRDRHSLRTSPNSSDSMYLIPPHARFDDSWLVSDAKSPLSMSATFAPRADRHAAETAPLMPPPTTSTSNTGPSKRATFALRKEDIDRGAMLSPALPRCEPHGAAASDGLDASATGISTRKLVPSPRDER